MSCHVAGNFGRRRRRHYLESVGRRAQGMQLTLVYGAQALSRPPSLCSSARSAHPLMMADPLSLIEPLDKKGMLRAEWQFRATRYAPLTAWEREQMGRHWKNTRPRLARRITSALQLNSSNQQSNLGNSHQKVWAARCVVSFSNRATSVVATR